MHASPAATRSSTEVTPEAFVLELIQSLHRNGLPAYRIEDAVVRVGEKLGLVLQVFTVPTGLTVGIGPLERQTVRLLRVRPGSVRLARIAELAELIERLVRGDLSIADAHARLAEIEREPPLHGGVVVTAAYALAASSSAVFFGAGAIETVLAAAIGCVVGALADLARRSERFSRLFLVLASAAGALLANVATLGPWGVRHDLVMLAAIIMLMPGHTLTVALNELVAGHLASGTARMGGVLATLLLLGCGAAAGATAGHGLVALFESPALGPPAPLPGYAPWIALLAAPLAFKVLFQARNADAPWIVAAAALASFAAGFGYEHLGPLLGPGFGSFALGLFGNALARVRHRPAQITSTPGLLVLVPGSLGFRGVSALLAEGLEGRGIELVADMFVIGVSLVCGLMLASVVVRSQRTL